MSSAPNGPTGIPSATTPWAGRLRPQARKRRAASLDGDRGHGEGEGARRTKKQRVDVGAAGAWAARLRPRGTTKPAAKGAMARLSGGAAPSMPDTEATIADLRTRISNTIDYVKSVPASAIDGSEEREVVLKFPNGEMKFTGLAYLTGFVIPNFLFHVTTAYAILRHNGVPLGKMDFLGRP
jgi:hypothetical protein